MLKSTNQVQSHRAGKDAEAPTVNHFILLFCTLRCFTIFYETVAERQLLRVIRARTAS